MVYYHGTQSSRLGSIKAHGICPPKTCPVRIEQNFPCDVDGVYVATRPESAAWFASIIVNRAKEKERDDVIVFEVDTKGCEAVRDAWGEFEHVPGNVHKVIGCDCLTPIRKCTLPHAEALRFYEQAHRHLGYDFENDEPEPPFPKLDCKWKRL